MSNAIILFLVCSSLTGVTYALDAVVAIRASGAVDIQALRNVAGTSAVYKVKRLNFFLNPVYKLKYNPPKEYTQTKWNYMVLGQGFSSVAERTAYMNKITSFHFVLEKITLGLTVNPHFNHAELNKIMAKAPRANLVKRPLKAARTDGCDKITVDDSGRALVASFSKYGDERELKKYAGNLLMRVWPALGATYSYSAVSDEGKFDAFTIMDYVDKATWCEYALSELVKNNAPSFSKSFQAMAALAAVRIA